MTTTDPSQKNGTRISRRRFLRTSGLAGGGLVIWMSACTPQTPAPGPTAVPPVSTIAPAAAPNSTAEPAPNPAATAAPAPAPAQRTIPKDVDAWLKIGPDGTITLSTGKVEFGQGIQTAFGQLVADELDVPFNAVQVIMGSTDRVPYDIGTFGSLSMRATGPLVRQASAEMRQWLLELGAQRLGVSQDALTTANGAVVVTGQPDKSVSYAELASGKLVGRQMSGQAPLKNPDTFTVVGSDVPRVDIPGKVDGSMKYGYDTTVPGMLHGRMLRPPSAGATLASVDYSQAQGMPGVAGVYRDGDFVGLAAERLDQANAALTTIQATWNEISSPLTHENIYHFLKSTPDQGKVTAAGDIQQGLARIVKPLSVTVSSPYLAHAQIEPPSSLAQPNADGRLEVWSSTQVPFDLQAAIARALNMNLNNVIVHAVMSGGAFGRKDITDPGVEAARLAVGLGKPVRVNWNRQEEFQMDWFRPAMRIELQTGLDGDGNIAGWKYALYSAAYYAPIGSKPMLAAADAGAHAAGIYGIPDIQTTFYQSQSPFPVYFWRANGAPVNALARETALDELAQMAGMDPVTFREKLLGDQPRLAAVMHAVVQKAGWTPSVGQSGQGIGLALDFADGTYVAEVARVAVDQSSGVVHVQHIDVAIDCGLVVNPANARAQAEGGVIAQGVSSTLKEQITFANGKVTNNSYGKYGPLHMDEAPSVDVIFVEDKTQPMQGMGEPAVGPVSAAISNAIYDAIGVRLRDLPLTPAKVQAALQARG